MTVKEAFDILKGNKIADTKSEIEQAERMATYSLELIDELESLIDTSFDVENYEFDSNVLIAINDFKSIARNCKKQVENVK